MGTGHGAHPLPWHVLRWSWIGHLGREERLSRGQKKQGPWNCALSSRCIPPVAPPLSLRVTLSSVPSATETPAPSLRCSPPKRRSSKLCATMPQPFLKSPRRCCPTSPPPAISALFPGLLQISSPSSCALPSTLVSPAPLSLNLTPLLLSHLIH